MIRIVDILLWQSLWSSDYEMHYSHFSMLMIGHFMTRIMAILV